MFGAIVAYSGPTIYFIVGTASGTSFISQEISELNKLANTLGP
jgi:hypothetical protein